MHDSTRLWIGIPIVTFSSLSALSAPGGGATPCRDASPPSIALYVPQRPDDATFPITVLAAEPHGIAQVSVSVNGDVVATRARTGGRFTVTAPSFPVEICAMAVDAAGNSAMRCAVAGGTRCNTSCEDPGQYCWRGFGSCGGREGGACVDKGTPVSSDPTPVCGCDGHSYEFARKAAAAGTNVAHAGVCAEDHCRIDSDCRSGEYCAKLPGYCRSAGLCLPIPADCLLCCPLSPPDFVCGCDGRTHDACRIQFEGINIAHAGECRRR